MLSFSASSAQSLTTLLQPGTDSNAFNVTVVGFVSDTFGATTTTSLGETGAPLTIVSNPPNEVMLAGNFGMTALQHTLLYYRAILVLGVEAETLSCL